MIKANSDILLQELLKIFNFYKTDIQFNLENKFYLAALSEKTPLSDYDICFGIHNDIHLKVIDKGNSTFLCTLIINGRLDYIRNQIDQNLLLNERSRLLNIMDNYITILKLFIDKKRYPAPVISGDLEINFTLKNNLITLQTIKFIDSYRESENPSYSYYPDGIVVMAVSTSQGRYDSHNLLLRMLDDYYRFVPPSRDLGFIYDYKTNKTTASKLKKMKVPTYEGVDFSEYLDSDHIDKFIELSEILNY